MSSAALVGTDGSIDWCCLPRFDSPSVFGAILDQDIGGRFRISPADPCGEPSQEYVQDTNILETTFRTGTGVVSVMDFMPIPDDDEDGSPDIEPNNPPEIHRIVTCKSGYVDMQCDFRPRHDYARVGPDIRAPEKRDRRRSRGRRRRTDLDPGGRNLPLIQQRNRGVRVHPVAGRVGHLCPGLRPGTPRAPGALPDGGKAGTDQALLAGAGRRDGLRRPLAGAGVRSFLVLHLMMYRRTGAIVAAPTTSLPETLGGSRNWDYRFSWLRDTSFTVDILYRLGDVYGGDRYIHWLLEQCQLRDKSTRIVYGISPDSSLREEVLEHLRGYEDSRPVRIGNGAASHLQLDVFGEVILAIHSLLVLHDKIPDEAWELVHSLCRNGDGKLASPGSRRVGSAGRATALRLFQGDVLGRPRLRRLHRRGAGPAPALPPLVAGRRRDKGRDTRSGLER